MGQVPGHRHGRAGPARRAVGGDEADLPLARPEARLLPLGRVPPRPGAGEQPHRHRAAARPRARRCAARAWTSTRSSSSSPTPGLGNGGLGRLAACFLDSLATLGYPRIGYGIRYEFGIFEPGDRRRPAGRAPDEWLQVRQPLGDRRPEKRGAGALLRHASSARPGADGTPALRAGWTARRCSASPTTRHRRLRRRHGEHAAPLAGARLATSSTSALFNDGDYERASRRRTTPRSSPRSSTPTTRTRRARSCGSSRSTSSSPARIARHRAPLPAAPRGLPRLPRQGRHPAQRHAPGDRRRRADARAGRREAPGLGRGLGASPSATFGYTNHTLLPEALETWPVTLFERLLPRHLQIIYEINQRFLRQVQIRCPSTHDRLRADVAHRGGRRRSRCAWRTSRSSAATASTASPSCTPSCSSATCFRDFYELLARAVQQQDQRRDAAALAPARATRGSSALITARIGDELGRRDLEQLDAARAAAPTTPASSRRSARSSRPTSATLADHVRRHAVASSLDPDVDLRRPGEADPRVQAAAAERAAHRRALSGAQARTRQRWSARAPSSSGARPRRATAWPSCIIRLINDIAEVVNADRRARPASRWCSSPTTACRSPSAIIPAADLSEQISTAGKEASGTGNMKFALNGALTIGTLDGANIEIRDAVGPENFFLFGLTADEVAADAARRLPPARGGTSRNPELKEVLDLVALRLLLSRGPGPVPPAGGRAARRRTGTWCSPTSRAYADAQRDGGAGLRRDPEAWARKALLNVARVGRFSARTGPSTSTRRTSGASPRSR